MQHHLASHLIELGCTLNIFANNKRGILAILIPPMYQLVIVGSLMPYLPIELGNTIVNPSFVTPQQNVSIQLVIVLQTIGTATIGIVLYVAVDTKRRNTELHPRLGFTNGIEHLFYEKVYIVTAPVTNVGNAIVVGTEIGLVRDRHTIHWIGIEIVVDMQSVDIITLQYVAHHITDVMTVLLKRRIEQR